MAKQYTLSEAAKELGISLDRVHQFAVARGLGSHRGREWQFSEVDIRSMRQPGVGGVRGRPRLD